MSLNQIDRLNEAFKQQLRLPWANDRSGGERVWFLVFEPIYLRRVMAQKELFRQSAEGAGRTWAEIDLSLEFGDWMRQHRYADRYFARPNLARNLADDFAQALAINLKTRIASMNLGESSLLALTGTEALYGIVRISHLMQLIEDVIPGRLLVFFPGSYVEPQYRFLNARDGWNYLAVPILAGAA